MDEKKVSTLFEEMKDDLSGYVSNRFKLLKLQTYAKTSKTSGLLGYGIIIISLILFALSMVLTTLAIYLGETLGKMSIGFAIVSVLTLLILVVIILARKSIRNKLTNIIVSFLMDDDKN
ncbi:MAG: phage holin family protein [Dysgonamonadaceae bacterium]|nr:phage holin family protein [Dysgonamonadaceae bacterium]MDD4727886.1 phage holin family protein [Dysgonamonadaceae bacterium]